MKRFATHEQYHSVAYVYNRLSSDLVTVTANLDDEYIAEVLDAHWFTFSPDWASVIEAALDSPHNVDVEMATQCAATLIDSALASTEN